LDFIWSGIGQEILKFTGSGLKVGVGGGKLTLVVGYHDISGYSISGAGTTQGYSSKS
jgi:hypothetical protein